MLLCAATMVLSIGLYDCSLHSADISPASAIHLGPVTVSLSAVSHAPSVQRRPPYSFQNWIFPHLIGAVSR